MTRKRIVFIGFGEIASTCATILCHDDSIAITGVCRSIKPTPEGVQLISGDIHDVSTLNTLGQLKADIVVITLTPSGSGPNAYRDAYAQTTQKLAALWQQYPMPQYIIYVSSTGVYAQNDGQWVDESSPACPASDSGKYLLEAEKNIQQCQTASTIIRFSGIYGLGRLYLLNDVVKGNAGSHSYTNRIHIADCAGIICFLIHRHLQEQDNAPLYIGSDCEPVSGCDIRYWLAKNMGIDKKALIPSTSTRGGNKRCSNQALINAGFVFQYPTYKQGYLALIDEYLSKR